MAAIQRPDPMKQFRQIQPRNGFPVQNMGGLPQSIATAPAKPFITQPTVGRGAPGPLPTPRGVVPPSRQPPAEGVQIGVMPGVVPPSRQPPGAAPGGAPQTGVMVPPPPKPIGTPSPTPVPPPAPAPTAPTPGAPTPTPAPPTPGSSTTTGSSGQTGVVSPPAQGDLEAQIREYLGGAFKGSVTPEFIQRAKEQVFRNVGGQTRQSTNRVNEDAIRRGLYKSGIPAEGIANVEAAGQGAMASGISDILNAAEAQNIQGRQAAAGTAGDLLSANRSWEQYQDQKKAQEAARRAAGAPRTFDWTDPETGETYQLDESWF